MEAGTVWEGRTGEELRRGLELPALELHASLPSTSLRVRELWHRGAAPFTAVLADRQTAGKGRYGRRWASPPGTGVWFSILLPARAVTVDGLLPLRIGVGLARRLQEEVGVPLALKWPNDLLDPRGGKVGGILVERISGGGADAVIAGIGVNVTAPPPGSEVGPGVLAAALARPGEDAVGRWPVLAAVARAVREARSRKDATLSPEELEAWHARDALRGTRVRIAAGAEGAVDGLVRGIDGAGRILLETEDGLRRLASGSVERGSSGIPPARHEPPGTPGALQE